MAWNFDFQTRKQKMPLNQNIQNIQKMFDIFTDTDNTSTNKRKGKESRREESRREESRRGKE